MPVLALTIFSIVFPVLFAYLFISSFSKERRKFSEEKKRVELLSDSFSGLTSITGTYSALDYIANCLKKTGFDKVLILTLDREKMAIIGNLGLGFDKNFSPETISVPLSKKAGGAIFKTFYNQE